MRIGFITYEYPPDTGKGGIGTYTQQIADLLQSAGEEVHVFAGSHTRGGFENVNGVHVHRTFCTSVQDFREKVVPCFRTIHAQFAFDVIESAEIHANAFEIKKAFSLLPLVVRLHAPNYIVETLKKRYVPFLFKLRFVLGALRRGYWDAGYWRKYSFNKDDDYQFTIMADAITAPSTSMKEWAVNNWAISGKKISVIGNPFNPAEAFLKLPAPTAFDHKTVLFFGRLNVLKGLVHATKAMKKILATHPEWKFKVIGDDGPGPAPNGLQMRAWMKEQLCCYKDRVIFYDGVPYERLPELLKEGEIVILPSLFESFSYACLEAMAAGKAVVGSKNGGMNDLINNGKTGLLIDPEIENSLYKAIDFLITKPESCFEMARLARIQSSITSRNEAVLKKSINLYRSLING
jgi:glycosyltransferase involved in cell wall biosynthesis